MKQIFAAILAIVFIVSLITVSFTYSQVENEEKRLESDIQYRSSLLAGSLKEAVEPNFINKSDIYLQDVVERFVDNQRIAGLAITDNKGTIVAVSSALPKKISEAEQVAVDVMDEGAANGSFVTVENMKMYVFASPLHDADKKSVVGSLIVVQNAGYIDTRLTDIWKDNLIRLSTQAALVSLAIFLVLRWIIFAPISNFMTSLKVNKKGVSYKNKGIINNPIFRPLFKEVADMQKNLIEARMAVTAHARVQLEKLDSPWTSERLTAFMGDVVKNRKIFVVSNREPYVHTKDGTKITYHTPASGMATAVEPIMQATGGTWIATGSGDADREVVDSNDRIAVPPNDPKYTLRRVWLTEEEEKGFYLGFSNEGLWPLCHMTHVRPIFRKENWEEYKNVNEKFAKTVLQEIKKEKNPIVFIQDFHFSLLPRLIREKRKDVTIGMFWHIPWPNPEAFSICPWRKELIDGMLGADIIGFHTQLHCNNFITTVGRELESLIDLEEFAVTKSGHTTHIKPFPISIAFSKDKVEKEELVAEDEESKRVLKSLGINSKYLALGVDRLDYTKGILERLKAVEIFLTNHKEFIGDFTFLQLSAPSRTSIKEYQDFNQKVQQEVDRINNSFKKNGWKPVVFLNKHHGHDVIYPLYRAADVCLVTPLHDGMNLVAKEFVASRNDEKGVLILSHFTGASRELIDALIINPYNAEATSDAIYEAITMKVSEQKRRMRRMRDLVRDNNVFRWSAQFFKSLVELG